jgi:hypothetical protein
MADNITFSATILLAAATPTNLATALLAAGFTGDPGLKELTITNNTAAVLYKGQQADPTTGFPIQAGDSDTTRASGPSDLIQSALIWLESIGGGSIAVDVRGL